MATGGAMAHHPTGMTMAPAIRVGVIAALEAEAKPLAEGTRWRAHEQLHPLRGGALIHVSGMGFDAAARGAYRLIEAGCGALVSWGLAGALDPGLRPGAVVIPESILLEDAQPIDSSSPWRARVAASLPSAVGGKLLTSRRALASAAGKRRALERTGAVAVDMESYAIASVAGTRGLPFLAVRVIVDTAADDVPDALADAADGTGRIAIGRLIARLIEAPGTLGPLLRLASRFRAARGSLHAIGRLGVIDSCCR